MAQILDIQKVTVGTEYFTATIRIDQDAPLRTSEDLYGTTRVYNLMPDVALQACMGDKAAIFRDVMGDTELPHLLEHVTIELLARTNLVPKVIAGRTWPLEDRLYTVQFPCVDDVLVAAALSSAVWIIDWAYTGGGDPVPDVDGIVKSIVDLVKGLDADGSEDAAEDAEAPADGYMGADDASDYGQGYEEDYPQDDGQDYGADEDLGRGKPFSAKIL